MKLTFTFRHMDSSDALKKHAEEKISKLSHYLAQDAHGHIILSTDKYLHKSEINLVTHGVSVSGKESSEDMYNSIQRTIDKIEKQLKKYKDRMVSARPKEGSKLKMQFKLFEPAVEEVKTPEKIIETKEFHASPMMLDEALMQMDLLNNDILVFLNVKTNHINVLYRKSNNKYALIETTP